MDKKEKAKAYIKEWSEANKERLKEYKKEYYLKNKDKIKEYRQANKEHRKEKDKEWREANKQRLKEYTKEYVKTPNGKKSFTIINWKNRGLINEDYDSLYQKYLESTNCEECGCEYGKFGDGSNSWRCMDHCHISGLFRNFLCNSCNTRRG